jgi:hypothetical protein
LRGVLIGVEAAVKIPRGGDFEQPIGVPENGITEKPAVGKDSKGVADRSAICAELIAFQTIEKGRRLLRVRQRIEQCPHRSHISGWHLQQLWFRHTLIIAER